MTGFTCNFTNDPSLGALNDLYLDENGNIASDSGQDEIVENCYHTAQLCVGDLDFDTTKGIPWDTYLQSDIGIGVQLKLSLAKAINQVKGVNKVSSIVMEQNPISRVLLITIIILLSNNNTVTINI